MRNKIRFEDNCVSTVKIKSNIKNQKKKLNDARLQEVTVNYLVNSDTNIGKCFFFWRNKPLLLLIIYFSLAYNK